MDVPSVFYHSRTKTLVTGRQLLGDERIADLRRLGDSAISLDEWLNIHEYLVKVLRKFEGDIGVLQRSAADIVWPLKEMPGFDVFARWFRGARECLPGGTQNPEYSECRARTGSQKAIPRRSGRCSWRHREIIGGHASREAHGSVR